MPLTLKLEVRSDPQMLSVVRSAVQQLAAVAGFADRDCRLITLAVDEAMANIIRHAYNSRTDRPIELSCWHRNGRLEFLLVDYGKPVPPEEIRGRPLHEVRPGGLGVHLIKEIMDSVRYEPRRSGNHLRLSKRVPKRSGGEDPCR